MGKLFYQIFIGLYPALIKLISPFNSKAKFWTAGRKHTFQQLRESVNSNDNIIWMHCASLGEFEQGRPLLEKLRSKYPTYKLLLSFFSPSGYEVRKNYNGADLIIYLPMDNQQNAKTFFDIAKPELIIFIKYDFWFYYLQEAKKRNTPLLLVSGIFRKDQLFFKSYGAFYRKMLFPFTHFFVQNEESLALLKSIGITSNVTVSGDTRFDRVIEIAEQFSPIDTVETFCADSDVIVAGSTWSEDDVRLSEYANSNPETKFIIAPHDITKDRLSECARLYKNSILFSTLKSAHLPAGINTIIIDNIGMLSRLYKYSTVSYIGGGFGKEGVHNVLEAAVYGNPVVFGPEYRKFIEAIDLITFGGAFSITNTSELRAILSALLKKDKAYTKACLYSSEYVFSKKGSTEKILVFIQEKRLLTN